MKIIKKTIKNIPLVGPKFYFILQISYRKTVLWMRQALSWFKWRRLRKSEHIKLELGSGAKSGSDGWTTVDLLGAADITHDLRRGIPLKNSSVDAIYTSHMFEHIPYPQLINFISECRRTLKPGAYLSVCVPNARHYIQAYFEKTHFISTSLCYGPALVETGSFLDQVNYIAYMNGQLSYLFDEENIVNTLKKAGFLDVKLREFDPNIDMVERDYESIYAIAKK